MYYTERMEKMFKRVIKTAIKLGLKHLNGGYFSYKGRTIDLSASHYTEEAILKNTLRQM